MVVVESELRKHPYDISAARHAILPGAWFYVEWRAQDTETVARFCMEQRVLPVPRTFALDFCKATSPTIMQCISHAILFRQNRLS
jgi:hypothetical protein